RAVEIAARCLTSVMSDEIVKEFQAYFGRIKALRQGAAAANTSTEQAEQAPLPAAGNGAAGPANTSAEQAEQAPCQSTAGTSAKANGSGAAQSPVQPMPSTGANTGAEQPKPLQQAVRPEVAGAPAV